MIVSRLRSAMLLLCVGALLGGCQPADTRPGLWLSGEPAPYPEDWTFAHTYPEIALEVSTPYLLPHSITIWCAALDGDLYIAAGRPETKNWPGWVDADPNVRIRVGDDLYEARVVPLEDEALIRRVMAVQAEKYGFEVPSGPTGTRYWIVTPRDAA
jgi:hypothetical protein